MSINLLPITVLLRKPPTGPNCRWWYNDIIVCRYELLVDLRLELTMTSQRVTPSQHTAQTLYDLPCILYCILSCITTSITSRSTETARIMAIRRLSLGAEVLKSG